VWLASFGLFANVLFILALFIVGTDIIIHKSISYDESKKSPLSGIFSCFRSKKGELHAGKGEMHNILGQSIKLKGKSIPNFLLPSRRKGMPIFLE